MKLRFRESDDVDCKDEVDGPASSSDEIITTSSIDLEEWYGEFEREFVLLKSAN